MIKPVENTSHCQKTLISFVLVRTLTKQIDISFFYNYEEKPIHSHPKDKVGDSTVA